MDFGRLIDAIPRVLEKCGIDLGPIDAAKYKILCDQYPYLIAIKEENELYGKLIQNIKAFEKRNHKSALDVEKKVIAYRFLNLPVPTSFVQDELGLNVASFVVDFGRLTKYISGVKCDRRKGIEETQRRLYTKNLEKNYAKRIKKIFPCGMECYINSKAKVPKGKNIYSLNKFHYHHIFPICLSSSKKVYHEKNMLLACDFYHEFFDFFSRQQAWLSYNQAEIGYDNSVYVGVVYPTLNAMPGRDQLLVYGGPGQILNGVGFTAASKKKKKSQGAMFQDVEYPFGVRELVAEGRSM